MEEDTEIQQPQVVDAGHVYLLMKDDVRISRNSRALWYFRHLNTNINLADTKKSEELDVLSVIPRTVLPQESENEANTYRITPCTAATFLAKKYRFVFILDISPSVASVDHVSCQVVQDEIFDRLRDALIKVTRPFCVPGSSLELSPDIYITVIAHTPLVNCNTNQVLVQGYHLKQDNVYLLLEVLRHKLDDFENVLANCLRELMQKDCYENSGGHHLTGGLFDDILERPESPDPANLLMTPDVSFINMLRYGILALQLLPENTAAGVVVITDGVVGLPDASLFESLMTQLRHNTIACSFIPVSPGFNVGAGLGHVPFHQLLQFLATATFGAYFGQKPKKATASEDTLEMNTYHLGLLTWSFQKALGGNKVDTQTSLDFEPLNEDLAWSNRIPSYGQDEKRLWATPLMKKKHTEHNLHTSVSNLISCRLREGYTIRDVVFTKGDTQMEVTMVLPWRNNVWIRYVITSNWPLTHPKRHSHVEVTIEGSYDFLHDVTCPMKKPFKSPYRQALVKKYWQTLQVMSETDQLLVHLQSFASNTGYYKVPDSVHKGVPVFDLPPNSNNPHVNIQHSSKDAILNQFANFWKPILLLDVNIWQKWMHTHRIGIVLEHDVPLGKHLHTPNSSGRFHSITCRQAVTSLNSFLSQWSTFVLMENHSYIKLIFSDPDKPPNSFFVLRVASKPPCVVLRLAFLGGTSGKQRNQMIDELVSKISMLTFPQRGTAKDDKGGGVVRKSSSIEQPEADLLHRPPLQRLWCDIPCCVLTTKPVEKILIRYDRLPHDFMSLDVPLALDQTGHLGQSMTANRVASSLFGTLSRFLHHRRWVWSVQQGSSMPISLQAIGRILSNLTKIRLQEGFHFANANAGVVNMVAEVDMKIHLNAHQCDDDSPECEQIPPGGTLDESSDSAAISPCVLQYIVFPPHTTTTRESVSEDDTEAEMELTEADGELQIITEMWVEPQYGIAISNTPESKHLDNHDYKQLATSTFPKDLECISTMVTFEHLNLMCQSLSVPSPAIPGGSVTPPAMSYHEGMWSRNHQQEPTIQHVPFAFDLMRLLPKCQQVELLFSTLIQDLTELGVPHLRSDTITPDAPEALLSTSDTPQLPNDLLFGLLLDSLKDLHDREVHLSDFECEQLLNLVKQRERDQAKHPLPFLVDEGTLENVDEDHEDRSESTFSMTTSTSLASYATASMHSQSGMSGRTSQSNQTLKQVLTSQWQNSVSGQKRGSVSGPGTPFRMQSEDHPSLDLGQRAICQHDLDHMMRVTPRWRCYIKSLTSTHIIVTFCPASYDDLRLLVQGQGILRVGEALQNVKDEAKMEAEDLVEKINVDGVEHVTAHYESVDGVEYVLKINKKPDNEKSESDKEMATTENNSEKCRSLEINSEQKIGEDHEAEKKEEKHEEKEEEEESREEDTEEMDTQKEATEKTAQNVECEGSDLPSGHRSFNLPIFVYNCPLSSLTDQLVNKWTYTQPCDIFQDLTFKVEMPSHEEDATQNEKSDTTAREDLNTSTERRRTRTESGENVREKLRFGREEVILDNIYGDQDELKQQCTLISEHYFRCFVIGVFQSLLRNHNVVCQDIDAAINGICEESLPLEVDITRYMHSICGHVRHLVEKANIEQMMREDLMKTLPKAVENSESSEESPGGSPSRQISPRHHSKLPLTTHPVLKFPLALLQGDWNCESNTGLHDLVKTKFTELMHNYFKPVPSNPDFYFYCPPTFQDTSEEGEKEGENVGQITDRSGSTVEISDAKAEQCEDECRNDGGDEDSDIFLSDVGKLSDRDSVASTKDSASLSSLGSIDGIHIDEEEEEEDFPPLFLYLTCSVRTDSSTLKSMPVRDLPTCLKELQSCLDDLPLEIDLNTMYITLDLLCLTLPPEVDISTSNNRPCYQRMASYASQMSYASTSPTADDREDTFSFVTSTEGGYSMHNYKRTVSDPLSILPKPQREVVKTCRDQMTWLLQDEIASALRLIVPVTSETLEMVATHVKASIDKPKCIDKQVSLQFVYGPEQSLTHFIETFERMNLPNYHLNKEGSFYYLCLDRVHGLMALDPKALDPQSHAQAITSALENLGEQSPGYTKDTQLKSDPDIKTESEVPELKIEDDSQNTVMESKLVNVNSKTAETDVQCELSEVKVEEAAEAGLMDNSVEVIPSPEKEDDKAQHRDLAGVEVETFRPEDIRISVIRPSPVKEARRVCTEVEDTEKDKGDVMENSSGSSIQILDEDKIESLDIADGEEDVPLVTDVSAKITSDCGENQKEVLMQREGPLRSVSDGQVVIKKKDDGNDLDKQLRTLSPLTVLGLDADRKSIKRAHSSASFEKYKSNKSSQSQTLSGRNTPDRRPSGPQTPNRSRHHSGLQTPLSGSVFDTSSRSSVGDEAGYDGDSSDTDEDGPMMSFSDTQIRRPLLPNFWLIMKVDKDKVDVFFHTRDARKEDGEEFVQQMSLYNDVIHHIFEKCRSVNQLLLLGDLYATRMCNSLLVPQADEDVRWTQDKFSIPHRRRTEESDDSDTDAPQDKYLAATMQFMPGHFACDMVWQTKFVLHPRLKTGPGKLNASRGVQALRAVLNRFNVNNRKNMFVIKETSGNVFYLRLDESVSEVRGLAVPDTVSMNQSQRWDEEMSLSASRSSSMLSLPVKKTGAGEVEDEPSIASYGMRTSIAGEREEDSLSLTPNKMSARGRNEECILLSAHGITPVGEEISGSLVGMLQKKLDEAVLDVITVMLARNPMCKLTNEDIQFIQPSQMQPKEVVRLTIPGSAMLQQFALGYYLRQNLLQFLCTPKYADNKQEWVFRDYTQPNHPILQENHAFLYNRPQHAGGKGIACLQLSFVDGRGNQIQLISSPKPVSHAYKDSIDVSMFDTMVNTTLYHIKPGQKQPDVEDEMAQAGYGLISDGSDGPAALVQFNIWERGDVDVSQLTDKLVQAMKHAVCDIIMEYRLLTAPICELPHHCTAGMHSPIHSAPSSPIITAKMLQEPRSMPGHESVRKQSSDSTARTPKEKSSTFGILSDVFKSKASRDSPKPSADSMSPASGINHSSTWTDMDSRGRKESEVRSKMHKYETGDRGVLNPVFSGIMKDWLEFCNVIGVPSIQQIRCGVSSRFALEYVLREFQTIVTNISPDISPKVFKLNEASGAEQESLFYPYTPSRAPVHTHETKTESSLDVGQPREPSVPGKMSYYIIVGRNVKQWQASMDRAEEDATGNKDAKSQANPRIHKKYQKYAALDPDQPERADGGASVSTPGPLSAAPLTPLTSTTPGLLIGGTTPAPPDASMAGPGQPFAVDLCDRAFVPRQRFLLMTVNDKEFIVYTYNWATDLQNSLDRQLQKVVQWHNARSHLLSCIISQKTGLFQHTLFMDHMTDPYTQESNPFIQSVGDVDLLVKYYKPPTDKWQTRPSTTGRGMIQQALIHPVFEHTYRDAKPPKPVNHSSYAKMKDPVHRHGAQMMELQTVVKRESEKRCKLEELYLIWQQRMGTTHMPISEDWLELLKTSSRLIHSVATPLLFSPHWRRVAQDKPQPFVKKNDSHSSNDAKPRSRHSSGASIRSKRSDSMDSKKRPLSMDSPDVGHKAHMYQEEKWHVELRYKFVNQYIQYLQSLGFVPVRTRPTSPKRTVRQRSGEKKTQEQQRSAINPNYHYLQKTLPGGIMLLEMGFKDCYFGIHVYAFECSRLPAGKNVNPQLAVIFTDECDKFKDLTHAHSFAHDFHLRIIQSFVSGWQQVFTHGYHLTGFLTDFIKHFPYVPSFARNYIYEGSVSVVRTNSSPHQLFDYMLNHDKLYGMRAIRMIPLNDDDSEAEHEFGLLTQFDCQGNMEDLESLKMRAEDYEVGLVITHDAPSGPRLTDVDRTTLRLRYYIILTSKKDLFPKHTLEKKLGVFKVANIRQYPATGVLYASCIAKGKDSGYFEPCSVEEHSDGKLAHPLPVTQHLMARQETNSWQETVNYLGYTNKHQAAVYGLLLQQAHSAKEKILSIVKNAMSQCRRDLLWHRMLLPPRMAEEEGRRKRRSERQGDFDEAKDPFLTLLTFSEFQELLDIVTRVPLSDLDHRLENICNMTMMWYQGLARVLTNKYHEHHRYFSSPDGLIQYVVVLNPNYLDAFMMLGVDTINGKAELSAVYREPMLDLNHTPMNPNLPALAMQAHTEGFVNACCFHMWSRLLQ